MKFYQIRDLDNINNFSMWVNWDGSIRMVKGDVELLFKDYKLLIEVLTKRPKKFKSTFGIQRTEEEKESDRLKELIRLKELKEFEKQKKQKQLLEKFISKYYEFKRRK